MKIQLILKHVNESGILGIMNYNVKLTWDSEASVWIATSDDVPGLVLESDSYDALIEKVKIAIPELIDVPKAL